GILNQYLQDKLPDCVERKPVNQLIHKIKLYKATHPNRTIRFFKTDYSSFYDNIDRKRLIQQLKDRDIDSRAINLVRDAIENPTCGGTRVEAEAAVVEPYGIPQGLSISNLLSSLYVREIDEEMKKTSELFIRYVDDIIILQPFQEDFDSLTQNYADKINLHLQLNPDKTKYGILGVDELEFLGYSFTDKGVTVKRTNVTNFLNRIAKECLNFRRLYKNKVLRPNYLEDDEVFVHTRLFLLDFSLKGIKVNGKYYGWLHHFQEIDDIGLLYMIDRRIRKQMLSFLPQKYLKQVSSLRKIYFQLMDGKADKVVYNYDNLKDVHQRRAYLIKRGLLDQFKTYSDEEIDLLFIRDREMIIKRNEANIGHKY
ncbi:MAG: hypothetical protein K2K25_09445, partial [Muribaculaceae bacterium]|nr:hypothetical protein [Muribaculaceae bacterium]